MTAFATAGPSWQELMVAIDVPPADTDSERLAILVERAEDLRADRGAVREAASRDGWTSQRLHRLAAIEEELRVVQGALSAVGAAVTP